MIVGGVGENGLSGGFIGLRLSNPMVRVTYPASFHYMSIVFVEPVLMSGESQFARIVRGLGGVDLR